MATYKFDKEELHDLMQLVFRSTVDAMKRKDHLKEDPEFIMSKYKLIITEHPIGNHSKSIAARKGMFSGDSSTDECITFVEIV